MRPDRVLRGALLLLVLVPAAAVAHTRSTSYSYWELGDGRAAVTVRVSQLDLTRLGLHPDESPQYADRAARRLASDVWLKSGGGDCEPVRLQALGARDGWFQAQWDWRCDGHDGLTLASSLFIRQIPQHLHFARVRHADGRVEEKVLAGSARAWEPGVAAEPAPRRVGEFFALGIGHILEGWDHLAFLAGLLLLSAAVRELVWLVTGFTVAHSLTLALAVLGLVQPAATAVEALIALSIVFVAVELAWLRSGRPARVPWLLAAGLLGVAATGTAGIPGAALAGLALFAFSYLSLQQKTARPARLRTAVTFAFGLFHGFGFAGVLAELGLPPGRVWPALLGFNLGVEAGQLLLVAAAWPVLQWLRRRWTWAEPVACGSVAGLGTFWFVLRAWG